jgi:hypothetical protein
MPEGEETTRSRTNNNQKLLEFNLSICDTFFQEMGV